MRRVLVASSAAGDGRQSLLFTLRFSPWRSVSQVLLGTLFHALSHYLPDS